MSTFAVVVIVVSVIGIALCFTAYFRIRRVLPRLGRSAFARFHDEPIAERPNEDDRDEPIPKRPLRGMPSE